MQGLAAAALSGKAEARWRKAPARAVLLWHLCSLDAPSIAVLWTWALGRVAAVRIGGAALAVLALGTWVVYVLDRVLDASDGGTAGHALQERHLFHARHQGLLLRLCGAGAVGIAALCRWVDPRLVEVYLLLGLPVGVYAGAVHQGLLLRFAKGARPLAGTAKEASVALLFTLAVVSPAAVEASHALRGSLVVPGILLSLVCWLNCACISLSEGGEFTAPLERQHANGLGRPGPRRRLTSAAALLAVCSAAYGASQWGREEARLAACLLLSTLLLLALVLGQHGEGRGAIRVRVLADLALLTPVWLLVLRP